LAESDIIYFKELLAGIYYPADRKHNIICFHATQITITKQDIDIIIKSLNSICNFSPIKTMRDSLSKKHKYEIVTEITAKSAVKKRQKKK